VGAEAPASFARSLAGELLSPTEPLYAETLSIAFVLHLLAAHGRGTEHKHLAPKGKLGALQLRTVTELVHAQLAAGLTLEVMARAVGYSPFQFARLFKATTGLAPHRFVLSLRLERACRPGELAGRLSTEIVADAVRGARVVKAFNTMFAAVLAQDPVQNGGHRVVFMSGNDEAANKDVAGLIERLGFSAVVLGRIAEGGRLQDFGAPLVGLNLLRHPDCGA
jgi:regulatory helix-turn-helix AraC family protein